MGSRKRLSSEERRAQIIRKATMLFSAQGYERMTVAQLAAQCKISEPALYRYFPSKEDLYAEVLKSLKKKIDTASLARRVSRMGNIEEILLSLSEEMMKTYSAYPEVSRLLLFCSLEGHAFTADLYNIVRTPYTEILRKALARLKRLKKIRPVDPTITARCFTGMVSECSMRLHLWNRMQGKAVSLKKTAENTVPIFARGLLK